MTRLSASEVKARRKPVMQLGQSYSLAHACSRKGLLEALEKAKDEMKWAGRK
jgi:hypothetical protein